MFVIATDVAAAKKVIATLLATALVLWASGLFSSTAAHASNITHVYDLLSDSSPAASSTHEIEFVTPSGVANGEDIVVTFPAGFDLTGIATEDLDVLVNGTNKPLAEWTLVNGGSDLTITIDTGSIAAQATTTLLIGTNATNEGVPDTDIVNPTPTAGTGNESYQIQITAGTQDSGNTRVVMHTVLMTASVDTVFDFTVYGLATSTGVNGTSTTGQSSSTTLPFGQLTNAVVETLAQDLTVATNAVNGFVVTVETDGAFESSTGADIDYFDDGATSTTPASWSAPANNISDENSWGHWGVTSEDTTTTRTNEFGSDEWVGIGVAPVVIFSHDGPADEVTPGKGSTTVGYQVEITGLQEAADDYSTVLTYIATPTF